MTDQTANKEFKITPDELFNSLQKKEPFLLFDLRSQDDYKIGHIQGAVHAVCDARSKETIMPKIPKNVKVVLIHDEHKVSSETTMMMRSMGLDVYYLQGGMKNWVKGFVKGNPSATIKPEQLLSKLEDNDVFLLDVREADEFSDFNIPGSTNISIQEIFKPENISKIPKDKEIITICPHGNIAMVASFALARNGIKSNVLEGGLASWNQILKEVKAAENPTVIQVEKIGKGCLSHLIISGDEAIVIDPLFPAEKYQEIAKKEGVRISRIIDTHQHADHISAAQQLANLVGAAVYESKLEVWERDVNFLDDGDEILFGKSKLRAIHTPGHTPGSLSYVVDEKYVFTGDILFVESIGRPDLRDKVEEFAEELYDSLQNKLLKLPPNMVVFPTHHGPSVKSEDGVFLTTIVKAQSHEILKLSKKDFVNQVASITMPRPMNYQKIIQINKGSIPLVQTDIPELELGPNRCSIAGA